MATQLKILDRNTPMLLPPDLRDWIPPNHIVHFLLDAVERLPEDAFSFNHRGTGDAQGGEGVRGRRSRGRGSGGGGQV